MSDARTRELERHAGDDPAAAAAAARARCRAEGHQLPTDRLVPLCEAVDGETGACRLPCARCGELLPCKIDFAGWTDAVRGQLLGYPRLDDNPDDPDPDRLWELSREWRADERMGREDGW